MISEVGRGYSSFYRHQVYTTQRDETDELSKYCQRCKLL